MSILHLRTISTLLITCHHKVSETNEFRPPVPNQRRPRHWLSLSRFAGYNAKQVLARTVSCLPTDLGDKTHGGLATVHLRFLQITRVTKVITTDELLLLFLVWLTLLGPMHRATSNQKANLYTGSAVREKSPRVVVVSSLDLQQRDEDMGLWHLS